MMTTKLKIITTLIYFIIHSTAHSQPKTSFFEVCNTFTEKAERTACEKEKILAFIHAELMPYLSKVKSTGSSYEIRISFNINNSGMVDTIRVNEKHTSGLFPEESLRLSKKFQPVRISDFNATGSYYSVVYKIPKDQSQQDDISILDIINHDDEIFKVVESMPRFPGCEQIKGTDSQKEACAKEKMLDYIYKNLKYPEEAKINNAEGQVVVQFVIEKDGLITQIKMARDLGYGLGQAAMDVVESMNSMPEKWTPGTQKGKAVRVLYTLPVKFKL